MLSVMKLLARSVRDYFRDEGPVFSAALAYSFIMAVVPVILFLLGLLGYVIGDDAELFNFIINRILSVFPTITRGITRELQKLVAFRGMALTSIALYAFLSYQLYSGISTAFERIFAVQQKRPLWQAVVMPFVVVTLVIALLVMSFMLTSMIPLLQAYQQYVPWIQVGVITKILLRYVVPFLIVQLTVMILYTVIPNRRINNDDAFRGAFFTTVMLEVAKHGFTWFMVNISALGTMYGSLSLFVTFLLWVYYSAMIFYIGAEVVHNLGLKRQDADAASQTTPSPAG